ncbi:TolC family protein [Vibrio harveyi]|uniref:TolC family protein n=1 Tax=Vibrio harveyi TaxID=669 RepID=UPI003CE4FF05
MKFKQCLLALSISAAAWTTASVYAGEQKPGNAESMAANQLSQIISTALTNDDSRRQFYAQAQAMRATGKASSTQQDPKLKFGVSGLPVDSFAFDEDAMTNISVGISQQFGRGDTLELNSVKANQQASGIELKVTARELEVINAITKVWLELGYQQVAHKILLENKQLMEELEAFIQTNYSIGKSEAQDLINAQLQVTKLDEKLQANAQTQQRLTAQLSEWLGSDWLLSANQLQASNTLDWSVLQALENTASNGNYYSRLNQYPTIRMVDASIEASRTHVDIAKESYSPQFGVEMAYGYRQANNMKGEPASDVVSAFITMDIPLFTGNRQDQNLAAAQYQVGAAQSQKDTLLKQLNAKVNSLFVDQNNLSQRIERFESTLIPQAISQVKATERGYQNNTAQFNDVILATRDELALKLEYQRLITDLNLTNNNLSALLNSYQYQVDTPQLATSSEQ